MGMRYNGMTMNEALALPERRMNGFEQQGPLRETLSRFGCYRLASSSTS